VFKLKIGEHTYLKDIYNPLEIRIEIGKFCSISFSLGILGDDHACISLPNVVSTYPFDALWGMPNYKNQKIRNEIIIGNDVWIGMGVWIRPGITVGDGAIIGAGTVVTKNVLPYEVVSGNPMKQMRLRYTQEQIYKLLQIKWWDWSDEKIKKNIALFENINEFLKMNFQE
jgi:chloramphenicol O-acetyltransferase type B